MRKMPVALPAWAAVAACLVCCGDNDEPADPEAAEPVPQADRQTWNSTLHLQGPQSTVTVHLPYAQEFDERKVTQGEGGVSIEFHDKTSTDTSGGVIQIRAQRLSLEHDTDRFALAGSVAVTSDSVLLTSDSLLWSRTDDLVQVPGWADVARSGSSLRVRDLSASTSLERWSAKNVSGSLSGTTKAGAPYELRLRAKRDSSSRPRDGYLRAVYETVAVRIDDQSVGSQRAKFDAESGLISFSGGVELVDSMRTIHADWLEHDLSDGTSSASGSVVVEEGDWRLQAQEIHVDKDGGRWVSSGMPVVVEWEERSLRAAHLIYDNRIEPASFVATGDGTAATQIEFRDRERLLVADSLTYHRVADRVEAAGNVALTGPEFAGVVRARHILLALDTERAQLSGSPRLIRQRAADTLVIAANTLTLDLAGRQVVGDDAFSVVTGALELKAQQGHFDSRSERLTLSRDVELTAGESDTIHADSMTVTLVDGVVTGVALPASLTGSVATSETQVSWFDAGGGHLLLELERVQRITLTGDARVTHRSLESNAINRFTAVDIEMNFTDGELATVIAQGDAVVQSRLADAEATLADSSESPGADQSGSVNRVAGNRLEITIEDGAVIEVKASESVEGEFVPASSKAVPTNGG
jgi:lipopolysaccharide export system protein LptA